MNGFSNLDETDREYLVAHIDDLFRFWRLKVTDQSHSMPSRSNLVNTISHEILEQSR